MTEFKRVYFGTVLGYLWSLIRPLMLFGVLLFVFTKVFQAGSDEVEHYPVLLLLGIVLFTFFQEATTNAVTSVVAQEGVVRKTQFPRLVIPLATVLTGALQPLPEPGRSCSSSSSPSASTRPGPGSSSRSRCSPSSSSPRRSAMALSVLYVRFRDVAIIWVVVAQVLFYATPILYPVTAFKAPITTPRTPADGQPAGGDLRAGPGLGPRRTGRADRRRGRRAAGSA